MDFAGKNILVVGGSGVLGGLLVTELASLGASVLATCSSQDSAGRIPDLATLKLLLDLKSAESIQVLANYLNQSQPIDGIVLASGRVGFGKTSDTKLEDAAELMQINYLGQSHLVNSLLANVLQSSSPFVAAITGVVAEKTFPGMSAYSASKKAMSSWLETLRLENNRSGLLVLDAKPGHTETGLATRPLFGVAPAMPVGMAPPHVVAKIIEALKSGTELLPSSEF